MSFMVKKKIKKGNAEEHAENGHFINYISDPPALQHIVAVCIASRLWSEPDIKENIRQYSETEGFDSRTGTRIYKEYEKRVSEKLPGMLLSDKLKYKVLEIFRPIGLQLFLGFAKEIEEYYYYGEAVQNKDKGYCRFYDISKMGGTVCWTMEGIIDNVTSLKELINNEERVKDFDCLYELVCKYCFEEYIPYIWEKISPEKKSELDYSIYENYDYHIVAYWTSSIENKLSNIVETLRQSDVDDIYDINLSIEQNMISLSIFVKNPYSLKYFWNKLKEYERKVCLEKWLKLAIRKCTEWETHEYQKCNDKTSSLCFLLSQLKEKDQQKEVFQAHPDVLLKSLFFDWPWQRFFLPTFYLMMDYVSEKTFVEMMSIISHEFREGNEILIELFRNIWLESPLKLKKSIIQVLEDSPNLIYRFINMDDLETIFMILKYASEKESKRILFNMIESYELFDAIQANKLSLIDTLLTKYLIASDDMEYFKRSVMVKYGSDLSKDWIGINDFEAVEKLFAWSFKSQTDVREFKETLDKNKIYSSLVCLGDYEVVDRFMSWYFEDENDINKFKNALIHEVDEDNSSICSDLLWELSVSRHGWEKFEDFVSYHFSSPEEVTEFKNMLLKSLASFLESYRFDFAHKLVKWCLGSTGEVNRFKNSFVTSEKGMKFLIRAVNKGYPVFSHPNKLIRWLSISKELAAELKGKLDDLELFKDYCSKSVANYKRWALFYMLDKHAEVDNIEYDEDSVSWDEDRNITAEIMKAFRNR